MLLLKGVGRRIPVCYVTFCMVNAAVLPACSGKQCYKKIHFYRGKFFWSWHYTATHFSYFGSYMAIDVLWAECYCWVILLGSWVEHNYIWLCSFIYPVLFPCVSLVVITNDFSLVPAQLKLEWPSIFLLLELPQRSFMTPIVLQLSLSWVYHGRKLPNDMTYWFRFLLMCFRWQTKTLKWIVIKNKT